MNNFSVLISVYLHEKPEYLREALNSIFNQTILPNEVILVKDGPLTSELDQVIKVFEANYSILKIVSISQNQGLGNALNIGLSHCNYELVARMDSDDICKYNRFEEQLKIFEAYPDLAVVGSWIDEFEGDISNIISQRKLPETSEEICKFFKKRCPFNHPSVMFRKDLINSVGGYMPFYLFEDYYLWGRVISNKYPVYNIQQSLLYFRTSSRMIARRGGLHYAKSELRLQQAFLKMKLINHFDFLRNICIRFIVRLMPNVVRMFIYRYMLR